MNRRSTVLAVCTVLLVLLVGVAMNQNRRATERAEIAREVAQDQADQAACASRLSALNHQVAAYAKDHHGAVPSSLDVLHFPTDEARQTLTHCPADGEPYTFTPDASGKGWTLTCPFEGHASVTP